MNKKQGIFELWLKNFLSLVFMQSFQAIFLAIVLIVVYGTFQSLSGKIGDVDAQEEFEKQGNNRNNVVATVSADSFNGGNSGETKNAFLLCSIIAYAGLTAVIKLDKLIKGIFGIEDSPLLGDLSKNMRSLMHSAWHAVDMGRDIKGRWNEAKSAGAARKSARTARERLSGNLNIANAMLTGKNNNVNSSGGNNTGNNSSTNININNGGNNGYSREQLAALFSDPNNFDSNGKLIERSPAEQMLYDAARKERDADREYQQAKARFAVRALSTVAGVGVASGASDSLEETLATGNYLSDALTAVGNKATKPIVNSAVRTNAARQIKQNQQDIKNATDKVVRKNLEDSVGIINKAVVDSTMDVSTGINIPKNMSELKQAKDSVKKSIQTAADDWLNTQFTVDTAAKVTRKESKDIIKKNRKIQKDNEKKIGE